MFKATNAIAIVLATIAIVSFCSCSKPSSPQAASTEPPAEEQVETVAELTVDPAPAPKIVFDETFHDFGVIDDTKTVQHDFVFWNRGDATLVIKGIRASGTGASYFEPSKYEPGERGVIPVVFTPKGRTGHQAKSIRVETNDPKTPITNLRISSDIFSVVSLDPRVFRFEQVEAGSSKTINGTVRLQGEDFGVTGIEVLGDYVSGKILGTEVIDVADETATSTEIKITIHDDAPLGWMDSKVIISTDNPKRPTFEAPIWAEVLGPIHVLPAKLPLGVVRDGVQFKRQLLLVSRTGELINIVDWVIECNIEDIDMQIVPNVPIPDDGAEIISLVVTGTGPDMIGKLEGRIIIQTTADKRPINVPFHCIVRAVK